MATASAYLPADLLRNRKSGFLRQRYGGTGGAVNREWQPVPQLEGAAQRQPPHLAAPSFFAKNSDSLKKSKHYLAASGVY